MYEKLLYNFLIGLDAILQNKLRAFLTSLGIIFGVASVIAMLAIGKGAETEILEQLKILGTNNIIIQPIIEQSEESLEGEDEDKGQPKRWSPGLTLKDAEAIADVIPHIDMVSPEIVLETAVMSSGIKRTTKLVGISENYPSINALELAEGRHFSKKQIEHAAPVCIIGYGVKNRFFPGKNPIGERIKCGKHWLTIIGISKERTLDSKTIASLGIRNYNMDVYTPIKTMLLRFRNRAAISEADINKAAQMWVMTSDADNEDQDEKKNYHQIDRMVVRIDNTKQMANVAEVMARMLERRHNRVVDFQIIVPEELLKQKRRTQDIFNMVLFAIAFISLLVGGIGIMNIMLASVMERIKEIGLRLSIGATRRDIILQFLSEAVVLSLGGGIVGVITGILISVLIEVLSGITTVVSIPAMILSFMVSITIGILFGIFPAKRAADQDPVDSLRYE